MATSKGSKQASGKGQQCSGKMSGEEKLIMTKTKEQELKNKEQQLIAAAGR